MFQKVTIIFILAAFAFAPAASADDYPGYYPKAGFQRTGTLDSVQLDRQRIIINDIPYFLSNNFIVHSMSSFSVPATRLQAGTIIGYKMASSGRLITEIWLLPKDYKSPRRR